MDKSVLLTLAIRQVGIFKCAPVKVAKSASNSIEVSNHIKISTRDKTDLHYLKLRSILHTIAACLQVFQCVAISNRVAGEKHSTFDTILGWFTCIAIVATSSFIQFCRRNGNILEIYLNNLFAFKEKYGPYKTGVSYDVSLPKIRIIDCLNLLLIPGILFTSVVLAPCHVLGIHWWNPCKPSLTGYFLLEECHQNLKVRMNVEIVQKIITNGVKATVFIVDLWVWWFGVHGTAFSFIAVHIIGTMLTRENILLFRERLQRSNNIYRDAIIYRQIQLFSILCNCVQRKCLGVLIGSLTLVVSMNFSLLVGFANSNDESMNVIMLAIFLIMTIEGTVALLVILAGMVAVYKESKMTLVGMKKLEYKIYARGCRIWLRKYRASCGKIKIMFGCCNFLEELTPLRCLDLALNLTLQFLLLSRST